MSSAEVAARTWTLRDLRRALSAGWAPDWVAASGWWTATFNDFYGQPYIAHGSLITALDPMDIVRGVDRRVATVGARAPAWLPPTPRAGAGKSKRPPSGVGQGDSAQASTPSGGENPNPGGGKPPSEQRHAELTQAPPAGGSVRPEGTAQAAPPAENDPVSREGEDPAPRAGERTARSGVAGDEARERPPRASQKAHGGTEADPRGASPAAPVHPSAQETPGTAGPATELERENDARAKSCGAEIAVSRSHEGGSSAHPANDAAGASGSSPTAEVANDVNFGGEQSDLSPVAHFGGVTATWAGLERTGRELRQARQLSKALQRWLQHLDVGGVGDPTPRVSGARLVRELVTRRCALSRARRWERAPGLVVVLVDVSGSCSVAAPGTLAAARDFAAAQPGRVAVVVHSNGHVVERHGVAATWPAPPLCYGHDGTAKTSAWILEHGGPVLAGALALGDWDAGHLYQALAQRAPLIWLDSYAARNGVRPASKNLRQGWTAPKRPVVWWQGVQTAAAAAAAVTAARTGAR